MERAKKFEARQWFSGNPRLLRSALKVQRHGGDPVAHLEKVAGELKQQKSTGEN